MRQHSPISFISRERAHKSPSCNFEAWSANPSMLKAEKYRKKIRASAALINIGKPVASC
jgi:hypothetical protein